MMDLIGHKTSKGDLAERIFYTEEILRDIFEDFSISEIRTPALESSSLFKSQLEILQILLTRNYILF